MIESFFPSLKHRGVEHLLISGQATVLYGAATLENIFTLSALTTFFETHPGAVELTEGEQAAALKSFGRHVITGRDAPEQPAMTGASRSNASRHF